MKNLVKIVNMASEFENMVALAESDLINAILVSGPIIHVKTPTRNKNISDEITYDLSDSDDAARFLKATQRLFKATFYHRAMMLTERALTGAAILAIDKDGYKAGGCSNQTEIFDVQHNTLTYTSLLHMLYMKKEV